MKQQKIQFRDIKGTLSRDEMKEIKGGTAPVGGTCGSGCDQTCTITTTNSPGKCTWGTGSNANRCFCVGGS